MKRPVFWRTPPGQSIKDSILFRTLLLLLLFCLAPDTATATPSHYRPTHSMEVRIDPRQGRLVGSDEIRFNAPVPEQVKIRLSPHATHVRITVADRSARVIRKGNLLSLKPNGNGKIQLFWQVRYPTAEPTKMSHDEDPSYGIRASMSSTGAYLAAGSGWYPEIVSHEGFYVVNLDLPSGFWGVTAGKISHRSSDGVRNRITFQADYPLTGLNLAVGRWVISRDEAGEVPVYTFFREQNTSLADVYLEAAKKFLALYEQLFGPYPFHKFAIVENFLPTGYGFPSWTLLGKEVIRLPFMTSTSLGHEIAHSWWGNGVRIDYSQGNWAEGLTTYVADYLYKEQKGETAAFEYRQKLLREYTTLVPSKAMPLQAFVSRDSKATQAIGYGKAAMLFHDIRRRIGDDAFWKGLRILAGERMFQQVAWDDLIAIFSRTSGTDQAPLVRPWLSRGDIPDLELAAAERTRTSGGWRITGELRQNTAPWPLHLECRISTTTGVETRWLDFDSRVTRFSFDLSDRPLQMEFAPGSHLMRRLSAQEIPVTVNSLRALDNLQVYLDPELDSLQKKAAKVLLAALRKDQLRSTKGLPARNLSKPSLYIASKKNLPEEWQAPEWQPAGKGKWRAYDHLLEEETSMFSGWKTGRATPRFIFLPASVPEAVLAARKIPHYGRYSSLLFKGAENSLKKTREAAPSPLIAAWSD